MRGIQNNVRAVACAAQRAASPPGSSSSSPRCLRRRDQSRARRRRCGAARPAWVENDEALSRKIEAGLTGKREDDALSPLRGASPSSKAEKAATAWLKKARSGDVPLDVAEVEAVIAVLKRCRGVIPDDAKEAAPMTLAEARRCLKKAVAQLVAGDASVEVEVERWDAVVRGHGIGGRSHSAAASRRRIWTPFRSRPPALNPLYPEARTQGVDSLRGGLGP